MIKTNFKYEDKLKNMLSEEEEEIGVNVFDDEEDDDADRESSPYEESIEEDDTVAENPNAETFSGERMAIIDNVEEDEYDLYKLANARSVQLSRLPLTVESLESQIKKSEGTRLSGDKTARRRRTIMKTKNNKATAKKTKGKK